jgi:hypothetical protein
MSDLKSLRERLDRFSKTAERFNKADTNVSHSHITFAEASLREANVNFDFWLDEDPNDALTRYPVDGEEAEALLPVDSPDDTHECEKASFLGFAKIGGRRQFAVRQVVEFTAYSADADGSLIPIAPRACSTTAGDHWRVHLSVTPLAQASLTIQVAAVRKLPAFIDAFESAINEATPAFESAINEAIPAEDPRRVPLTLAGIIEGVEARKKKRSTSGT